MTEDERHGTGLENGSSGEQHLRQVVPRHSPLMPGPIRFSEGASGIDVGQSVLG